ncbi:hypothetical protein FGG08_001708 [Glutinoglossum americanum]|uniref:Putative phospholipase n=1 Tax=Glutinoglossum americanum TaxID=1670608 RepID=A0A9P8ID35_9PEZI|nr:hypothetical protein FGG08_001708 [Glutinoglossum americanum]
MPYFPRLLYYITIPVRRNAPLLPPATQSRRWPVLVFSHGLGGSHNTYSHLLGSLASHGMVVVAPSHRDGSAPVAYIRDTNTATAEGPGAKRAVEYRAFAHEQSPEVEDGRNEQLETRLWELELLHEALLKIDRGEDVGSLTAQVPRNGHASVSHPEATSDPSDNPSVSNQANAVGVEPGNSHDSILAMFENQLDVHRPGSISWMGHSFGAATVVQFVKSVFYRPPNVQPAAAEETEPFLADYKPLFTPSPDSNIVRQITPQSTISLLDLWCLPLRGQRTRWLWGKPLPCYSASGPGGTALLAVLSEAFFKWRGNLKNTKRVLSAHPSSDNYAKSHYDDGDEKPGPRFFYPAASAHLSQSDFGILFPWVTKKVFRAENPRRTLLLNVRATLQFLRENGVEVAPTSKEEMEESGDAIDDDGSSVAPTNADQDRKIFERGAVEGWVGIPTDIGGTAEEERVKTRSDEKLESSLEEMLEHEASKRGDARKGGKL